MDIVQFLFSVVNLMLALVVLFGGRLIFRRLEELNHRVSHLEGSELGSSRESLKQRPDSSLKWKE